ARACSRGWWTCPGSPGAPAGRGPGGTSAPSESAPSPRAGPPRSSRRPRAPRASPCSPASARNRATCRAGCSRPPGSASARWAGATTVTRSRGHPAAVGGRRSRSAGWSRWGPPSPSEREAGAHVDAVGAFAARVGRRYRVGAVEPGEPDPASVTVVPLVGVFALQVHATHVAEGEQAPRPGEDDAEARDVDAQVGASVEAGVSAVALLRQAAERVLPADQADPARSPTQVGGLEVRIIAEDLLAAHPQGQGRRLLRARRDVGRRVPLDRAERVLHVPHLGEDEAAHGHEQARPRVSEIA